MTIQNHFNVRPVRGWASDLPSCTVPIQGKTIRELHEKYTRGTISSNVSYKPYYDDDKAPFDAPLTPDRLHATDPVDVEIAHSSITEYIDDIKRTTNEKMDEFKQKSKRTPESNEDSDKSKSE